MIKVRFNNKPYNLIEPWKKYLEMLKSVSVHSEDYLKMQDNCFNALIKSIIPDDICSSLYYANREQNYINLSKLK